MPQSKPNAWELRGLFHSIIILPITTDKTESCNEIYLTCY